jgi:hypothetical protein
MCLIKGKENSSCQHKRCANYTTHPDVCGAKRGPAIEARKDFGTYNKIIGHSADWIMAENPYEPGTEEREEFEWFRQGQTELTVHGEWPSNRMTFHRSEVSVEFVEFEDKWRKLIDVEEAAVYVGKDHMLGDHYLDILTPTIDKPVVTFTRDLGYLTPRQADAILRMFDTKDSYAKNFTALRTITSAFFEMIQFGGFNSNEKVRKMFDVVNNIQGSLLPDDFTEMESILLKNAL